MTESNIDPKLQAEMDAILKPYLDRLDALQKSHEQKDTDIILLTNAVENLVKQLDAYKDRIKRLPKGDLTS